MIINKEQIIVDTTKNIIVLFIDVLFCQEVVWINPTKK